MKIKSFLVLSIILALALILTGCIGNRGAGVPGTSGGTGAQNNNTGDGNSADDQAGTEDIVSLADVSRGLAVWKNAGCTNCHIIGDDPGGNVGPSLTGVGDKYSVAQLKALITNPASVNPQAQMPSQSVAGEDLDYLAKYLSVLSSDVPEDELENPAER